MEHSDKPNDPLFRDAIITSLTENELAFYLRQAWKELYTQEVTREQLCILWCHTSLEVGRGKFIYNNNFGNIKRKPGVTYTSYKCNEVLNGKTHWFEPYHPQTFFQHWDSSIEGAKAYLQFLNKKRYQPALEALKEGSMPKYCAKLKEGGYFTADLNYYTNLMIKLSKSFNKKADEFMTFVPENYKKETEAVPESEQPIVKESIPKKEIEIEKTYDTLPSAPEPEPKIIQEQSKQSKIIISENKSNNRLFELIKEFIALIIKIFNKK